MTCAHVTVQLQSFCTCSMNRRRLAYGPMFERCGTREEAIIAILLRDLVEVAPYCFSHYDSSNSAASASEHRNGLSTLPQHNADLG